MFGQMCCRFDNASRIAVWAFAALFTEQGDEEIAAALIAVSAGKAVSQNAANEIAAKCLLNIRGCGFITLPRRERQSSFEVGLDDVVPERFLGSATLIALCLRRDTFDCGIHETEP